MSSVLIEIFAILLLILINSLFSLSELAVVSSRRFRLEQMARDGDSGAAAALQLSKSPSRFLSTVQIGITLIGILTGAFGGATLAGQLAIRLAGLPVVGRYAETVSLIIIVSIITFLSVVLGELVPKRLALHSPERYAARLARPMRFLSKLASPVVRLLSATTDAVVRLFGIRGGGSDQLTEEELRLLLEQGAESGVIDETEREMLEGVFRLGDRPVRSMMTSRPEVVWLDVGMDEARLRAKIEESRHSVFPVAAGSLDRIIGVVAARDLLAESLSGRPLDLRTLTRDPLLMPDTMPATAALERFRETGTHLALLFDEYGGIVGLVTLIDMLEAIVGDLPTPEEIVEPPVVRRADGSWLVDALLTPDELIEALEFDRLPDEGQYQTLGGLLVYRMGRIPTAGDYFDWEGYRFEVVDMDGNRVDKVLISPLTDPSAGPDTPGDPG
jgi:putative hemolysin